MRVCVETKIKYGLTHCKTKKVIPNAQELSAALTQKTGTTVTRWTKNAPVRPERQLFPHAVTPHCRSRCMTSQTLMYWFEARNQRQDKLKVVFQRWWFGCRRGFRPDYRWPHTSWIVQHPLIRSFTHVLNTYHEGARSRRAYTNFYRLTPVFLR